MGKLVLIRHGESLWNGRNLFTGWVDVPLTQAGIVEASWASRQVNHIGFDVVYTSALIRSLQTAFIVLLSDPKHRTPYLVHTSDLFHRKWYNRFSAAEHKNMIPVYRCRQLNERYYGDLQGFSKVKIADVFSVEEVVSWRKGYTERPPRGESLKDTSNRVIPFFNRVIHIYRPDEEVLRPEPFGEVPEIAAQCEHHIFSMQPERCYFIPFTIMGVRFPVFFPAFRDTSVIMNDLSP